jgi:transcriptional regulator with XRE-family HTH domain
MKKQQTLGERIVELRERKGWNRAELARRAEVAVNSLYMIESGITKELREETATKIAKALGVDPGELRYGGPAAAELARAERELADAEEAARAARERLQKLKRRSAPRPAADGPEARPRKKRAGARKPKPKGDGVSTRRGGMTRAGALHI